ncbi:MAG: hypothetical protein JNN28_14185 [Saprospiraceae bacterium]|nr:hypothetical protein [Saprospiraceae bacterium]
MQKQTFLIAFLAAALLFSACHEHDNDGPKTNFTVNFSASFSGERLTKYKDYPFGANQIPLQFNLFSTYLSDIELVSADGSTHRLAEVEYLNFNPDNAPSDLSVIRDITYTNVPEGDYTGIRIGYGVKAALNAKNPADFANNHPLALEGEYWNGWDSYIFTKVEGKTDSDKNGSYDIALLYHCGSDAVYKVYTFNTPVHVHAGEPALNVNFDLEKLFIMDDGSYYDIVTNFYTSNDPADVSVAQVLMHNFEKATSVTQ